VPVIPGVIAATEWYGLLLLFFSIGVGLIAGTGGLALIVADQDSDPRNVFAFTPLQTLAVGTAVPIPDPQVPPVKTVLAREVTDSNTHNPWVILGGGWINLSVTGNGGPCQRVIPEGGAPRPRPHPLIYWGDLSVTGNGDLPLATQRRVESILTPPGEIAIFCHPPFQILHPPHAWRLPSLDHRRHARAAWAVRHHEHNLSQHLGELTIRVAIGTRRRFMMLPTLPNDGMS
jgi:hypothetical protein